MQITIVLTILVTLLAVSNLFFSVAQTVKFNGDVDWSSLVFGICGALVAFVGVQSGIEPDYAASLAIVGIVALLYATFDCRESLSDAKKEFAKPPASSVESR